MPQLQKRNLIWLSVILLTAAIGLLRGLAPLLAPHRRRLHRFSLREQRPLGYGYVWNTPPFKPVEGYTSFLWVVLLDVVWRVTGLEPPAAANGIALVFAGGTVLLIAGMVLRLRLAPALERYRLVFLALVLLGTLTNRTFLAWTSSGLETAMHNFWLTAWVFVALCFRPGSRRWLTVLAGLAVLLELTRPTACCFWWPRWRSSRAACGSVGEPVSPLE